MTLDGVELAEARHRAYALFGQALVHGLTPEVHERLAVLPALADVLPAAPSDEAAASHLESLSLDVFPYEAVFVDPEGLLEGPSTAAVVASYRNAGFSPDTRSLAPDHVGLELAFLAHLSAAEADALRDGENAVVTTVRSHARAFLEAHLLRWLPALVVALDRQADCAWVARVAQLVLELATSQHPEAMVAGLPEPTLDLDAPDTRVADIVRHLLRPAEAGLFVSRRGIGVLARSLELPTGFGPRAKMLEQVVFAAVDARRAPRLFEALVGEVRGSVERLRELEAAGARVGPWVAQLTATEHLLGQIGAALPARE